MRDPAAVGDSLRFAAIVAKLALELIARGRLLPGLEHRGADWVACWAPVTFDPGDEDRVRSLSASMPPALASEHGRSAAEHPPGSVAGHLLDAILDACARRFLSEGLQSSDDRRRSSRARQRSVVDQWLAALTTSDPVVRGDDQALAELAERLEQWRGTGERYGAHRMFRTCFRLSERAVEPALESNPEALGDDLRTAGWRVAILLQAKDDPSVLVPAEEVWNANGHGLSLLGRRIDEPQERLLGGLGHALRL